MRRDDRVDGFEAEVALNVTRELQLTGTASYVDAKYSSFENAGRDSQGNFVSFTGNRVEFAPKWTASGQIDYRTQVGSGQLVASANVTHHGGVNYQADNLPLHFQKNYITVDGRLGYELGNGVTIAVWGKNITKQNFKIFSRLFAGLHQVTYGEPRTYGVEASYRF